MNCKACKFYDDEWHKGKQMCHKLKQNINPEEITQCDKFQAIPHDNMDWVKDRKKDVVEWKDIVTGR